MYKKYTEECCFSKHKIHAQQQERSGPLTAQKSRIDALGFGRRRTTHFSRVVVELMGGRNVDSHSSSCVPAWSTYVLKARVFNEVRGGRHTQGLES